MGRCELCGCVQRVYDSYRLGFVVDGVGCFSRHDDEHGKNANDCPTRKQLVDELVAEAMIDGKRNIQVEFRAKTMDLAVSKQLLDFPNDGEIVVLL